MAEWLYEAGIGEARAALVEDGAILAARIEVEDGGLRVGTVGRARLVEILIPRQRGRVVFDDGREAVLDRLPGALTQGATLMVAIVREAMLEHGRDKPARAVPAEDTAMAGEGPDLLARITATGTRVRTMQPHEPDALEAAGWSEVIEEARTGDIAFSGGALRMATTPAMTVFDVDGAPPLDVLARTAAVEAALAIERHDIGGSIGIDFPTLPDKAARQAVVAAFDAALALPFERTAVNGFGFLQVIRRRDRPSLPERIRHDPVGAAARAILRSIERTPGPVSTRHSVPVRVADLLAQHPDWIATLDRRTGAAHSFSATPTKAR